LTFVIYEETFFLNFFISVPLAANTGWLLDAIIYLTQREKKYYEMEEEGLQ
jgi:hypothetical protein